MRVGKQLTCVMTECVIQNLSVTCTILYFLRGLLSLKNRSYYILPIMQWSRSNVYCTNRYAVQFSFSVVHRVDEESSMFWGLWGGPLRAILFHLHDAFLVYTRQHLYVHCVQNTKLHCFIAALTPHTCSRIQIKGRFPLPEFTARVHGPSWRPVNSGAFLTWCKRGIKVRLLSDYIGYLEWQWLNGTHWNAYISAMQCGLVPYVKLIHTIEIRLIAIVLTRREQ